MSMSSGNPRDPLGAVRNVLLLGARGCGKTTVGTALAPLTGRRFVDLDALALAEFDVDSVHEVWQRCGEAGWRRAEVRVLDRVLAESGQIVALGGGTPMIDAARQMIAVARRKGEALTVYLRCEPGVLARRLA
ncbi:MAG: shikimate kinase, partial [Planctomycetota bacterium]